MLSLKDVTLFMADGRTDEKSFKRSLFAIRQSIDKVDFGEVIFQSAYDCLKIFHGILKKGLIHF